jgi:hypothetical protein
VNRFVFYEDTAGLSDDIPFLQARATASLIFFNVIDDHLLH